MANEQVTQGALANRNGRAVENMIKQTFLTYGIDVFSESLTKRKPSLLHNKDKYVLTNVKYENIYGRNGRSDFLIKNKGKNTRVEVRFQSSNGSVDEKMPCLLLNAMQFPEKHVILVVDGDGYRPGAREWLIRQVNDNSLGLKAAGKKLQVMTIGEFTSWAAKELAPPVKKAANA